MISDASGEPNAIEDFSLYEAGTLDMRPVLVDRYIPGIHDINQFIQLTEQGTDLLIFVDVQGRGNQFVPAAIVSNFTGFNLSQLIENRILLVGSL